MIQELLIVIVVVLAGCRDISNFSEEEFTAELRGDPVETIRSLDSERRDNIRGMGPEWPMVVALIGEHIDEIDTSISLLEDATVRGEDDFYSMHAEYLAQLLFDRDRFVDAAKVSSELLRRDPSARSLFLALRSHYRSQNDAVFLELSDAHNSLVGDFSRIEKEEFRLMRVVSMLREKRPDWKAEFFSMFVEPLSPEIHYRAYTFIRQRTEFGKYTNDEQRVMRAMSIAADNRPGEALDAFPLSVMNGTWDFTALFVDALGDLFLASGRAFEGYELLRSLPKMEGGDGRAAIGFWLGRLARAAGEYKLAVEAFAEVLPLAHGTGRSERIRWYLIDTARLIGVGEGIDALRTHGMSIKSSGYYNDTFDALLSDAVRRGRWNLVPELLGLIESYGDAGSVARARHIRVALSAPGTAEKGAVEAPAEGSSANQADVASGVELHFYRISEGMPPISFELPGEAQHQIGSEVQTPERLVLAALLEIQSFQIAYRWYIEHRTALSRRDLELLSLAFDAVDMHTEAMRVFDYLIASNNDDEGISLRLLELWFPRAYASIIDSASILADIPASLFFSVVREESYFNPNARSRSGALGLSQLMPATAADMASRLGMEAIDLNRPEDNLAIGAAYLAYCINLFDSEILGLVAYNAGLGRVRQWVRQFGDLDLPLFLQAIPFAETRNYVRKITRALWFYLALYDDIAPPAEMPLVLPAT